MTKRVLIINAYSARNAGDGLLVDLAVEAVKKAVSQPPSILIASPDPESSEYIREAEVMSPLAGRWRVINALSGFICLGTNGRKGLSPRLRKAFADADVIVPVGGGYMRAGSVVEGLKSSTVHLSQMLAARRTGKPWVLLPQSIGPYPQWLWSIIRRVLKSADQVYVRDDISYSDLSRLPNVERVADHAILEMAGTKSGSSLETKKGNAIGLVLRSLRKGSSYRTTIEELVGSRSEFKPLLQSSVGGNDDRSFFRQVTGHTPTTSLQSALEDESVSVIVSVRLHGAIQSLLAGVPAVHLSYERKGFSAFSDLGLSHYVLNARACDAARINALIDELLVDDAQYWKAIRSSFPELAGQNQEIIKVLSKSLGEPR